MNPIKDEQSTPEPPRPTQTPPPPPIFSPPLPTSQVPPPRRSPWRSTLITLGTIQLIIAVLTVSLFIYGATIPYFAIFLMLVVYAYVMPVIAIIALANIVVLILYLVKGRPQGRNLIFTIISVVVSFGLLAVSSYYIYQIRVVAPREFAEARQKSALENEARDQQYRAANANPEITKEEAISLLQTCKLKGFYYTQETKEEHGTSPVSSKTGIVLTKVDNEPYRISIADRLISELVPIAREAQKTCENPQFWHDGSYEQYKDGKWYFKDEVVNSTQTGKTRDEVLSFMKSCKTDYFVGYADLSLVKDANTQAWLEKAEKSTTGLEISEDGTRTYVFASKLMTTELQDTARDFRTSCYNTKKLYISVDNWIETEYPTGKWTRVMQ